MTEIDGYLPLPIVAQRLKVSYETAWRLVLRGILAGRQEHNGRWFVEAASVDRLIERHRQPAGVSG